MQTLTNTSQVKSVKKKAVFLVLLQEKKHCSLPVFRKVKAVALYLGLIIASVSWTGRPFLYIGFQEKNYSLNGQNLI